MIDFVEGDILKADAHALVNPVNCVGVMGRGVALQFKQAFPENFRAYKAACANGQIRPGKPYVFDTGLSANPELIINFPTKRHWRDKSRMEDIDSGLKALTEIIRGRGLRSIALPALGCGLGGLEWGEVRPRMVEMLGAIDRVRVIVYEPKALD